MGLGGTSVLFIAGFVVCIVGVILHIVGLATSEWSTYEVDFGTFTVEYTTGLFRYCAGDTCKDLDLENTTDEMANDIRAAQAMNIIGILLAFGALIVAIVHIAMGCMSKEPIKMLPLVAGVLAIVAFVFVLIGVAVYGGAIHDDEIKDINSDAEIGYSFALSIVGGILYLIGGILKVAGNMSSVGAA